MVIPTENLNTNFLISPSVVFYFLLIPTLILWYAYWKLSRKRLIELADKIPGPKGFPLVGNALEFIGSSHRKY